jgi:Ankyrin repeats (3 copies)
VRSAAYSGNVEAVEWLQQQPDIVFDTAVMAVAATAGHTAMCEYLHRTGCEWDAKVCYWAAGSGHVDTLRWLRENGCPWDATAVFHNAARNSQTGILDLIIEQGELLSAELLTDALNAAGARGRLQIAQWLRQHGAEWPTVLQAGRMRWTGESLL